MTDLLTITLPYPDFYEIGHVLNFKVNEPHRVVLHNGHIISEYKKSTEAHYSCRAVKIEEDSLQRKWECRYYTREQINEHPL